MINSAKQKKFYNTFVKTWQVAANQYQDRTGQILGDGANNGSAGTADGLRETIDLSTTTTVQTRLAQIGLDVPVTNTGNSGSYSVEGKYVTSPTTATLRAQSINGNNRNVFQLIAVPTDVAVAIDTMVDGTADAGLGDARRTTATDTALTDATAQWPSADPANGGTATVNMTILF
ncbi:MAG: hypothetical protein JU82_11100 [Sulfuricurvum sp. MLSB]|nr:MAG: hypothetical protein JU82_11100 [Sulfuricurvum sp. MLSB]